MNVRRLSALVFSLIFVSPVVCGPASAGTDAPDGPTSAAFAEPGISPDGKEIAFVSGGDIWSVASAGGDAHLRII